MSAMNKFGFNLYNINKNVYLLKMFNWKIESYNNSYIVMANNSLNTKQFKCFGDQLVLAIYGLSFLEINVFCVNVLSSTKHVIVFNSHEKLWFFTRGCENDQLISFFIVRQ